MAAEYNLIQVFGQTNVAHLAPWPQLNAQLGLGFANLGALLMSRGLPYDSEPGRAYAAAITALMCGGAYAASAKIA